MIRLLLMSGVITLFTFQLAFGQSNDGWSRQNSGTSLNLYDVCFVDGHTGWIVGGTGKILNTIDGGDHWLNQTSGTTRDLHAVFFVNSQKGWAVGTNGTVLHTNNGGVDWHAQTINTSSLIKSVYFVDDTTGWLCGDSSPSVYKTIDGGNHWICISSNERRCNSIFFINENKGWIAGPGVARTINGGETWTSCNVDLNSHSVYFINENAGWVVGSPLDAFKTTNGGTTWNPMMIESCLWLNDVFFIDQNHGWSVGDGVFKSANGGTSWEKVHSGTGFSAVCFIDTCTGWVVGENGSILKTTTNGVSGVNENLHIEDNPSTLLLMQNFPNPFNPVTMIEYSIPQRGLVTIKVYDILGKELSTLVHEEKLPGVYHTEFSGSKLSGGVYFYQLQSGNTVINNKMILMK
jgi:photosystem II stability/assembly factor-like uncharacterized protein